MSDEWNPNMKRRLIKNKSDRKRRKVSAIRQQHNLIAHRARDLDEEKRRRETENLRVARQGVNETRRRELIIFIEVQLNISFSSLIIAIGMQQTKDLNFLSKLFQK